MAVLNSFFLKAASPGFMLGELEQAEIKNAISREKRK
jgi:hypothetical protein